MSSSGSGTNLWEVKRREFLRTERGGEAGGSHKSAIVRCWPSHWQRWQNGKHASCFSDIPFHFLGHLLHVMFMRGFFLG